jgi:hypothetical protein
MENVQISKNFYLSEFTTSQLAARNNIDNMPNKSVIFNLRNLCKYLLQPLRDFIDSPIIITSGYRSFELNKLLKRIKDDRVAVKSQHCYGFAADIISPNHSPEELFEIILKNNFTFDKVILEFNSWNHVSYKKNYRSLAFVATLDKNHYTYYQPVEIKNVV